MRTKRYWRLTAEIGTEPEYEHVRIDSGSWGDKQTKTADQHWTFVM
jgi:hypothetical protein